MLIWLGLILTSGAWLFASTIVAPARPAVALVLGGLGGLGVLVGLLSQPRANDGTAWRVQRLSVGIVGLMGVFAAQWIVHAVYWRVSPYGHESVGGPLLAALLRLFGADAVTEGDNVSIQLMSSVIHVRPSIERLGVYPLLMLGASALTLRVITSGRLRFSMLVLTGVLAAYACGRFAVLSLLAGDLNSPPLFWNPWVSLASLLPLGVLGAAVMPMANDHIATHDGQPVQRPVLGVRRLALGGIMAFLGAAAVVFGLHAERAGEQKQGRILLDDLHSAHWEVSTGEFNEQSYGEKAIYNYICLRDWLNQFYSVRVNTDARISDDVLREVDVLALKTPTQPFLESERDAIERFVKRGGGLWLIGDHTNLFGMSTYLNPIANVFGLRFHSDDTFDNNTGRPSQYEPPALAQHPAVSPMKIMDFETSATLTAPLLARPVMIGYQLGSEMVDYGHVNFFGNITVDPEDEYGLFLQAAAADYGQGRVLAFADSTVFSSFSMFLPGVPELAEGSVEYLNHKEPGRGSLVGLAALGVAIGAAGGWVARSWRSGAGMFLLVVGLAAGTVLGGLATTAKNARLYTRNELKDLRRRALVDTSISSFRLPSSLDYDVIDPDRCFDTFYLNLARLGMHPLMTPALGPDIPAAPMRIFIQPTLMPSAEQLAELRRFVEGGGHLVILESSVFATQATRKMLEAMDMQLAAHDQAGKVVLTGAESLAIPKSLKPRMSNTLGLFQKKLGTGAVMYVDGAEWFSRKFMGQVYTQPDPLERDFHNLQYFVFHQLQDRTEHVASEQ